MLDRRARVTSWPTSPLRRFVGPHKVYYMVNVAQISLLGSFLKTLTLSALSLHFCVVKDRLGSSATHFSLGSLGDWPGPGGILVPTLLWRFYLSCVGFVQELREDL